MGVSRLRGGAGPTPDTTTDGDARNRQPGTRPGRPSLPAHALRPRVRGNPTGRAMRPAGREAHLCHGASRPGCHAQGPSEQAVIPAQAGIQSYCKVLKRLNDVLLLLHTLRAIRYANVRFGAPPAQSGLRRNDKQELDQNSPNAEAQLAPASAVSGDRPGRLAGPRSKRAVRRRATARSASAGMAAPPPRSARVGHSEHRGRRRVSVRSGHAGSDFAVRLPSRRTRRRHRR